MIDSAGRYRVVDTLYHDPKAFTQGLLVHNGYLYQSTGLYVAGFLLSMGCAS